MIEFERVWWGFDNETLWTALGFDASRLLIIPDLRFSDLRSEECCFLMCFALQSKRIWRRLGSETMPWIDYMVFCNRWDMLLLLKNQHQQRPPPALWNVTPRRPLIRRTRRRWRHGSKRRSLGPVWVGYDRSGAGLVSGVVGLGGVVGLWDKGNESRGVLKGWGFGVVLWWDEFLFMFFSLTQPLHEDFLGYEEIGKSCWELWRTSNKVGFERVNQHVKHAMVQWIGLVVREKFQSLIDTAESEDVFTV